jgi:hypothetical protein
VQAHVWLSVPLPAESRVHRFAFFSWTFHSPSILLKFNPMPAGLFQQAQQEPRLDTGTRMSGQGWFSFELFSEADVRDATWWLNQAYEGAKKGAAK